MSNALYICMEFIVGNCSQGCVHSNQGHMGLSGRTVQAEEINLQEATEILNVAVRQEVAK